MRKLVREILSSYPSGKESLIPVLQAVQARLGYLTEEVISEISRSLGLSKSEVYGVATFYTHFRFTPPGRHKIKVCLGTACHVRGGAQILERVERELGIRFGGTTNDKRFSLERVACVGSCALAPVIMVDGTVHGRMTARKVKQVLDKFK